MLNTEGAISLGRLALAYLLFLIPLAILAWTGVPLKARALIALIRMTVQLLFVGLYLQVIFRIDHPALTAAWICLMLLVADASIAKGSGLPFRPFAIPLFLALLGGTILPLLFLITPVLGVTNPMEARYFIPLGGMILGNCLKADIIGVRAFYESLRQKEKVFLSDLADGAELHEAIRPHARQAFQAALSPAVESMATIGLVFLPGMMTGVILGGKDPYSAIQLQIIIMIAIFTGSAITVALALSLTRRAAFTALGTLKHGLFREG